MNIGDLATRYFSAFSAMDVEALGGMLADSVTLRDWDVGEVHGKAAVLGVNRKIFASVTSIEARPLRIVVEGRVAACELEVRVDGKFALWVTDVIEFGEDGRILAIRAYRGN